MHLAPARTALRRSRRTSTLGCSIPVGDSLSVVRVLQGVALVRSLLVTTSAELLHLAFLRAALLLAAFRFLGHVRLLGVSLKRGRGQPSHPAPTNTGDWGTWLAGGDQAKDLARLRAVFPFGFPLPRPSGFSGNGFFFSFRDPPHWGHFPASAFSEPEWHLSHHMMSSLINRGIEVPLVVFYGLLGYSE